MAERLAFLYEVSARFILESLVQDMETAGLSLRRPTDGLVWLVGGEGGPVTVSLEGFADSVATTEVQRFLWWFAEDHNVYCRFQQLQSVRCIDFWMLGCDTSERSRIGCAIRERFLRDPLRSVGCVFDPEGFAEDYQWERFFVERQAVNWESLGLDFPEAVGMRRSDCARFQGLPAGIRRSDREDLVIFSSSPAWLGSP